MVLIEAKNVSKKFGGLNAVQDVSFNLNKGEILALIGPNGAGKTTTFNMIAGTFPVTDGTIKYKDQLLNGKKSFEIATMGIARTYQVTAVFFGMTVFENVVIAYHRNQKVNMLDSIFSTKRFKREEAEAHAKAAEILKFVNLSDVAGETASNLPYGKQRLLEIAIALAVMPDVVLLDEPAAGLNPEETRMLMKLISEIRDSGITILLVEHNMRLVMQISDRILVLDHGIMIAEGTPNEVRLNPKVIEAYLGKGSEE